MNSQGGPRLWVRGFPGPRSGLPGAPPGPVQAAARARIGDSDEEAKPRRPG
jgi:hypothetical protein